MPTERNQKRLVGWRKYLRTLLEKGGLYSSAVAFGCSGLVFLVGALTIPILDPDSHAARFHPDEPTLIFLLFLSGLSGALFLGSVWAATFLVKKARLIEPVTPITRHNTGSLPEVETLVRASDHSTTDAHANLLRAAHQKPTTTPEQLLRATTRNVQESETRARS